LTSDRGLVEALTHAAIGDIPPRHASPRLVVTSPDNRRAVLLLELDRAPEPLLVAALCELDDAGEWYVLAESEDGRLIGGVGADAVEVRFGVVQDDRPSDVMMVAGVDVPVTTGQGHFVAVNWNAVAPTPPAPDDLPANSGGYVRYRTGEGT